MKKNHKLFALESVYNELSRHLFIAEFDRELSIFDKLY